MYKYKHVRDTSDIFIVLVKIIRISLIFVKRRIVIYSYYL